MPACRRPLAALPRLVLVCMSLLIHAAPALAASLEASEASTLLSVMGWGAALALAWGLGWLLIY